MTAKVFIIFANFIFLWFNKNMGNSTLLVKKIGQNFAKYRGKAPKLSIGLPAKVDTIVAKLNGIKKEITTFRNSDGEIIERSIFDGKSYRNRLYTRAYNTIGNDEFVTSTSIKEYSLPKQTLTKYYEFLKDFKELHPSKFSMWKKEKVITNHLSENIQTHEKILSQTGITEGSKGNKSKCSFIEFPHQENKTKKHLSFWVSNKTCKPKNKNIIEEGVKFPKEDTFIAYRTMEINDMKKPITERFLRERKMQDKDVTINLDYSPQTYDEKLTAIFYATNGTINFNKHYKFKSKSQLVGTARHEVEHSWQYYLDARYNPNTESLWQFERFLTGGKLKSPSLKAEAKKYTDSINNYTTFDQDLQKYNENYIEIMANKAKYKAVQQYNEQGQTIRKAFPHIPAELL